MKNTAPVLITLFIAVICSMFSCKQKNQNPYAYNADKDTIPPVLALTVPVNLDSYMYGEDINMVGTATDLQSRDLNHSYSGKLKSLSLIIESMDPSEDTVLKVLYANNPNVNGKSADKIIESYYLTSGPAMMYCRLRAYLTDYADRVDSSIIEFTVHN